MSWKCHCPDVEHDDSEKICPICGMKVDLILKLSGASGIRRFSGGGIVQMGRFVYESIAGDDAQFVAPVQYHLSKGDDEEWYLTAVPGTMNATTVNDLLCEISVPVKLQDGDVIKIASRNDLTKNCAYLSISIDKRYV